MQHRRITEAAAHPPATGAGRARGAVVGIAIRALCATAILGFTVPLAFDNDAPDATIVTVVPDQSVDQSFSSLGTRIGA